MAGRTSYYGGMVLDDLVFNIDAGKQESYSKRGIRYMQNGDSNLLMDFADTSKGQSTQNSIGSIVNGATFSNFAPYHLASYSKYWHDGRNIEWETSAGIGTFYGNIEFDGIDDYIDFGATPEMDGNTDITVSTWFYVNNFRTGATAQGGTVSMIASRYNNLSTFNGWELFYDNQGVVYFGGRESSSEYIYASSSTLLKPSNTSLYGNGGWYNAIGTKSGNTWKLYLAETNKSIIDNVIYEDSTIPVLERSVSVGTGTTPFSTNRLILGKSGDSSFDHAFDGRIMSLSIYNRTLSISEITQNYKSMTKRIFKLVQGQCSDCFSHDVVIGTQIWNGCNTALGQYRNGDAIPQVADLTTWSTLTTGAWCYYNNDPTTEATYGKLYNWYAVVDPRGLAPTGYRVPSDADWTILTNYLGSGAGAKMKEEGLCHWTAPNSSGKILPNSSGFTGLPGGDRTYLGSFGNIGLYGHWWSSSEDVDPSYALRQLMRYDSVSLFRGEYRKEGGFSVRFIKDQVCTPSCGAWSYTYTAWSAWDTCTTGTQSRTRTANGTRTCILADCSTNIETSSNIESESQACVVPCPDCTAHDVIINTQTWTGCNATVSTYSNGDPIPYVDNPTTWSNLTTGAWCYYNNDPSTEATYGKLYNWYAVNDPRGIAPSGYHVPTDLEWTTLLNYLGGEPVAGGKMKEVGLCHWTTPNTDATNTSQFTGLPGGVRSSNGNYNFIGFYGYWWSSTEYSTSDAWYRSLTYLFGYAARNYGNKKNGTSLRFIKDPVCTPSCGAWSYTYTAWSAWSTCAAGTQSRTRTANGTRTCILADCSTNIETSSNIESESQACIIPCTDCVAHDVTIGTQIWTGCNATVSTYNNGDPIPYVDNTAAWAALTTGAWCYVNNDPSTEATYGKLYNWYAITDPRGIAPNGYLVPTDADWTTLTTFLGGTSVAGGKMKGLCHWTPTNIDATNTSLFTGLPGGYRDNGGYYNNIGSYGFWCSSTETSTINAWGRVLSHGDGVATRGNLGKKNGLSLRFIKNPCPNCVAHDVTIGTQIWTGCNATVSTYRDGTSIPYVGASASWAALTTGAWCYVNGDPSTEATYGKLYNWHAVNNTANGGIAPIGYHVPTDADWTMLTDYLGGELVAGGPLKETGLCHWTSPNTGATDTYGFGAIAGGNRGYPGNFNSLGTSCNFWTSTTYDSTRARYRDLYYNFPAVGTHWGEKRSGMSVRFIKDVVQICPTCVVPDVQIGTQIWTGCNLNVSTYRNGDPIPEIKDKATWDSASYGAWCWYDNDPSNGPRYGKLYNWYATVDPRGLAPVGYHVPTITELTTLTDYLGGLSVAGGKMKEAGTGTCHWTTPNTGADNSSGFTLVPAGYRNAVSGVSFLNINNQSGLWTCSDDPTTPWADAWANVFQYNSNSVLSYSGNKYAGLSVRLIKD